MPLDNPVSPTRPVPAAPEDAQESFPENGRKQTGKLAGDNLAHGPKPHAANQPAFFGEALEDAERLLKYAAEIGVEVDEKVRDSVLRARGAAGLTGADEKTLGDLLGALTTLAARLKPVTAESLKATHRDTRSTFRTYGIVALCLAIVVVLFSAASFITTFLVGYAVDVFFAFLEGLVQAFTKRTTPA